MIKANEIHNRNTGKREKFVNFKGMPNENVKDNVRGNSLNL